jgi:hypothetical protein
MKALVYRIRITFWLWELSGLPLRDAWTHAPDAMRGFDTTQPPRSPKTMAMAYIKYWGMP